MGGAGCVRRSPGRRSPGTLLDRTVDKSTAAEGYVPVPGKPSSESSVLPVTSAASSVTSAARTVTSAARTVTSAARTVTSAARTVTSAARTVTSAARTVTRETMNESGAGISAPPLVDLDPIPPPSPASSPHSPSLLLPSDAFDGYSLSPRPELTPPAAAVVVTAIGGAVSPATISFTGSVAPAASRLLLRSAIRESEVASPSPALSPPSPHSLDSEDSTPCPYDLRVGAESVSLAPPSYQEPCKPAQRYSGSIHQQLSDSTHSLPCSTHSCDIFSSSPSSCVSSFFSPSPSSYTQAHSCPLPASSLVDYHHYHLLHHNQHQHLQESQRHEILDSASYQHHLLDYPSPQRQSQSPRPAASPRSTSPPSSSSSPPPSTSPAPAAEPESPLTPPPTPPTAGVGLHGAGPSSPCQRTFREAVSQGNTAELRRILEEREGKVNVNLLDLEGQTALHHSCLQGNLELVKILVRFGADVKLANRDGWAPLHLAVHAGHSDVMLFLLALQQAQSQAGGVSDRRT
ncbi:hypothetical protein RRG08_038398 [Elysia crispata]|uniref:Notch n=1 Tax=Elysia crispata TaxID=231223 RepID=A0AAE1A7D5_9GAST|nr:hypothetical protein RRG08_038398 [Elysia crispata]